jgi:hypothetical protein
MSMAGGLSMIADMDGSGSQIVFVENHRISIAREQLQ